MIGGEIMYGAILGDIIGSPYEGDPAYTKNFPLFRKRSHFTDDTVMTIAVADAMMKLRDYIFDYDNSSPHFISILQHWGRKYPNVGYGGGFKKWLKSEEPKPYRSNGNGSAMRVSSVGWLYKAGYIDSIEQIRKAARFTARVTHNSEEGIKGAESVAAAIYLARNGKSKTEIKNYIESEFSYDLSRTIEEIRVNYQFEVSCQKSVPEAIIAFLESEDFESAVRNAIWLGGDADTQAAIAGSIAEAFYGIPEDFITECRKRLTNEMLEVVDNFYEAIGGAEIIAASKKKIHSRIRPDRMDRFTWHAGDLKIVNKLE